VTRKEDEDSRPLSTEAIIAISVFVPIAPMLIITLAVCYYCKKNNVKRISNKNGEYLKLIELSSDLDA